MKEVVVVAAVRTPIGSIGGALREVPPERLLRVVFEAAVERASIGKETIGEVIAGQAKQTTDAPNIARVAALLSGVPETIPSYSIHRQCASGMQSILSGVQQIQCGYSEIVLCGGVESMSTAPFYLRGARFGVGNGNAALVDPNTESQTKSQPSELYGTFNMIQTADHVAERFQITRKEQDAFAYASQRKAVAALDGGVFGDEIASVAVPRRKGEPLVFSADEYPKRDTNLEKLAKLQPIFSGGTVTAGNASGRNDGAAALVLMSAARAEVLGLQPLARVLAGCAAGVDPRLMGIGPVAATQRLLEQFLNRQGIKLANFDLFEINEAFAAQTIACIKALRLVPETVNVNGGAIALGHPLGCSGARISVTLLHEMRRRKARYGMASICVAGGLGMAMAFESV